MKVVSYIRDRRPSCRQITKISHTVVHCSTAATVVHLPGYDMRCWSLAFLIWRHDQVMSLNVVTMVR